ncbi:MAG: DUF4157 domain-containing protein [Kofleriaceae bacterium]|nr:DUF4157 domain-containing protein [Kofleriaceae bacterium]MCL4226574.1 DUF4157 domain-containing protein [Myxococcales bacterium]
MKIARKAGGGGDVGGSGAASNAPGKRTRTQSLPPIIQAKAEASTGADLSSVRVHDDAESHASCANLDALAYTLGHDIWFGAGQYQPGTHGGDRLIAHEVAHTVQQGSTPAAAPQPKLEVSAPGDALEVEADVAADAILAGTPARITRGAVAGISRAADWGTSYGGAGADPTSQNGQKASDFKAGINTPTGAVLKPASDAANTGGKAVNRSVFRLTKAELLEILSAAQGKRGLDYMLSQGEDSDPAANRAHAEEQLDSYIGYCQAAFDTMMIDTVEAQALFLGHAAGETAFTKMTEGQVKSNSFEDNPAEVKVSTSTASTNGQHYDGTTTPIMDGPMRYGQRENPFRGTVDPLGAIDGKDENSFDKTFIGRGPIQVTHKAGYVQALMFMEKRAEDLRTEAAAASGAEKAALETKAKELQEAADAIKGDPSQAAAPKYAFLFSAAHMQASPMVKNSPRGFNTVGMAGGAQDRQASKKQAAYDKAKEILLRHKAEDASRQPAQPGLSPFEAWDQVPGCLPHTSAP